MNRYRVDYYLNNQIIGHCYRNGFTRRDAYYESLNSENYKKAQKLAKKKCSYLTWDATEVKNEQSKNT